MENKNLGQTHRPPILFTMASCLHVVRLETIRQEIEKKIGVPKYETTGFHSHCNGLVGAGTLIAHLFLCFRPSTAKHIEIPEPMYAKL